MPPKGTSRRNPRPVKSKGRKKRGYKKRGFAYRSTSVPSNYPGFPTNKVVKMRYVETQQFVTTSAGYQVVRYRANSIYDPRYDSGGHQPIGHDQWQQFYNHYIVIGAKMTVQMTSQNIPETNKPLIFAVYLSDDATISTSATTLAEQGKCRYTILNGGLPYAKPTRLVQTFSAKKFFNISDIKDNVNRLGAPFGSNPGEEALFNVMVQTYDEGSDEQGAEALITIEYIVMFSEPKELPQS